MHAIRRPRQKLAGVGRAASLALLALGGSPTAQAPDLWGDVSGHVRDVEGRPLAGAEVRIEARLAFGSSFETAAEALFRRHRLPAVRSAADGSYRIPLLPDHREVSAIGMAWWLVVEQEGMQPWREQLPRGLLGYLGSEVTLLAADAADEVIFEADTHRPPVVWVGRSFGESLVVHLGPDGRGHALLPRVPCPLQPSFGNVAVMSWQILKSAGTPGLPSSTFVERPVHRVRRGTAQATPTPVTRRDGQPVREVRALVALGPYRRLVDVPDGQIALGPHVLGVVAAGCRMARTPPLDPLPATPCRDVRIVAPNGEPVTHARGLLLPCTEWRPITLRVPGTRPSAHASWRQPRAADGSGRIPLGELETGEEPAVLLVAAEGFEPTEVLDPRGLRPEEDVTLTPRASGGLALRVVDRAGAPIEGARLCLSDLTDAPAQLLGEDLCTDAGGTVRVEGLRPGDQAVFVMSRGHCARMVPTRVAARALAEVTAVLTAGRPCAWIARADDGQPVPFAPLLCRDEDGFLRWDTPRLGFLYADASGRLALPHTAEPRFFANDGAEFESAADPDGYGVIHVPAMEPVLVLPGPGTTMLRTSALPTAGGLGASVHDSPSGAVLFPSSGQSLTAHLLPAGRMTLSPEARADLPRDPTTQARRWLVQPQIVVVETVEECEEPEHWRGYRADESPLLLELGEVVVFRDATGAWRLTDRDVAEVWFLHPRHAPQRLTLTADQRAGRAPIRLAAQPGCPVSVDVAAGGVGATEIKITLEPEIGVGPRLEYRCGMILANDMPGARGQKCPIALAAVHAGPWRVTIRGNLVTAANGYRPIAYTRTLELRGTGEMVVVPHD